MEPDMNKIISSYRKELQKLMDVANVPMGQQTRVEEVLGHCARAVGVQPVDLHLCGEFDDETGALVRTFVGVKDPSPGSERELVEFKDIVEGEWQPPNSVRA